MSKATIYTLKEVPGAKRKSPRAYTHAVIGQWDYERELARAKELNKNDVDNFLYYERTAKQKAGDFIQYTGFTGEARQSSIDHAQKQLEESKATTSEEYQQYCMEQRVADVLSRKAQFEGTWVVLRWSQSEANALKSWSEFIPMYKNLKVVETIKN